MKKFLLLSGGIFLFFQTVLTAQRTRTETTAAPIKSISKEDISSLPFSRGQWEFNITRENLGWSHQDIKINDVGHGSQSQFSINLGTNYYVAKNIGFGLELDASLNTIKDNSKQTNNSWMTYANFTYGIPVNNDFNFYVRGGIGIGGADSKYTAPGGQTTNDKSDLFGYKFCAGFPIRLEKSSPLYLTPEFRYSYQREKFDNSTETDNRFGFGLKLETFLFCRQMECDAHSGYALSHNCYRQGRSYLGVNTRGMMSFGDTKSAYTNNYPGTKENYTLGNLEANYMYYIVNNLSFGAGIDFGSSLYKNSAGNSRQSSTSFSFMPMVQFNIPSTSQGLNNLYLKGGYGFGMDRSEFKSGNNTNTNKYSTTDFCMGLGYNFFFSKGLSFTPMLSYDMSSSKNKDTGIKEKYNGPEISIGIEKFF